MDREATLVFDADHPAFAGHFPGAPIVPGVLLLDAAVAALEQQTGQRVAQIASAKFLRPVAPGQILSLAWDAPTATRFEIKSGPHLAASGSLMMEVKA